MKTAGIEANRFGIGRAFVQVIRSSSLISTNKKEEIVKKGMLFVALVVFAAAIASAQTATPKVTKRQLKQQARIEQGVKSGQLTAGETRRLERQQAKITTDKAKAKSDGVVTPAERAKLAREQNRANRNIYQKKHNAKVAK